MHDYARYECLVGVHAQGLRTQGIELVFPPKCVWALVSAITVAEIVRGLSRLPVGKRQTSLMESFDAFMEDAFKDRVLPFDEAKAQVYGPMAASREKAGFNTDTLDLMIAASAWSRSASIATRNVRDFEGCGVTIINPWETE